MVSNVTVSPIFRTLAASAPLLSGCGAAAFQFYASPHAYFQWSNFFSGNPAS
jgi:hypothetical protein